MTPQRAEALLRGCLEGFDEVRLTVSGACMAPHAAHGTRVRLAGARRRGARFGDVVLTRTRDGLRLHRLVWPLRVVAGATVRTMADRATCLDLAVPAGDVLAVALAVERDSAPRPARRRATATRLLLRAAFTRLHHALRRVRRTRRTGA